MGIAIDGVCLKSHFLCPILFRSPSRVSTASRGVDWRIEELKSQNKQLLEELFSLRKALESKDEETDEIRQTVRNPFSSFYPSFHPSIQPSVVSSTQRRFLHATVRHHVLTFNHPTNIYPSNYLFHQLSLIHI